MVSLIAATAFAAALNSNGMTVVPSLDLHRYAGTWYEIARLPNRFQRKCAGDVSATYTLRPDGKVTVVNQCRRADGSMTKAVGIARPAGSGADAKLKVTFFWPFSGDYWVLDLDPEYRWALVGEPRRKYLWVLSRTRTMEEPLLRRVLDTARREGYDLSRLEKTLHRAQP
jgi:apolipoprotein D and lipocalin family protein